MVSSEKMAVSTAKRVVSVLNQLGIECTSDYAYKPVRKTLRECWYVKKLVECGVQECIYINLGRGSFLAVTDDCRLMTGMHCMVMDAIQSIVFEYADMDFGFEHYDALRSSGARFYSDDFDSGMILMEPYAFLDWVGSVMLNSWL